MKNLSLLVLAFLPGIVLSQSQTTKPVKILFDVTSKDTLTHQAVLRHVKGMSATYPDALLEVVIYGNAWPMVVSGKSSSEETVATLTQLKNVSFKICGVTMDRFSVEPADLVKGVDIVPDAIIEIVTRQGEGWGYIKESHN